MLTTIAVDAMGGDHAPAIEVAGAIAAAHDLRARILLVGREELIREELARQGCPNPRAQRLHIEIVNATEVITMEESVAQAVRRKRDSSIRVAARLVRDGRAHGLVSAGNTGAAMATAKLILGALPSVDRPALAGIFPTLKGNGTVLLDVGANAECKPENLRQFAIMGSIYSRTILGVRNPRVGVMSIGEEDIKGTDLTKETARLLKDSSPINFIGNVEGRDIFTGDVDVIVADGFTGNVILKTSEGLVEAIMGLLKTELGQTIQTQVGAILSRTAFRSVKKRLDYSEFGGAPLLGTKQLCVICHGGSTPKAIRNAIRIAKEFYNGKLNERIERELGEVAALES
ncbi:MAG: phosphate acyltransferase PlsX [Acidobacteria bacterium]|nr:phosphate acyltransferase PlsX [Acidobacteriota bacterium]MCW5971414.1 phosphate acyltransferase PlsX [Blastocatellales bacterium]